MVHLPWVERTAQEMTKALSPSGKADKLVRSNSTAVAHKYNSSILWGRKQIDVQDIILTQISDFCIAKSSDDN